MITKKVYYDRYMADLQKAIVTMERKRADFERYVEIGEEQIDLLEEQEHYEYIKDLYSDDFNFYMNNLLNIDDIMIIYNLGYINFTIRCLIIWFAQILKYLGINYNSISVELDEKKYVYTKCEEDNNDGGGVNNEKNLRKNCNYMREKKNGWSRDLGFDNFDKLQKFIIKHKKYDDISDLRINKNNIENDNEEKLNKLLQKYDIENIEQLEIIIDGINNYSNKLIKYGINDNNEIFEVLDKSIKKNTYIDNYTDYLLKENEEQIRNRISTKLRKNQLKSKIISVFREDVNNFVELKNKKEELKNKVKNNLCKNLIKSKVITCLRNLNKDKIILDKTVSTISKYKDRIKFKDEDIKKYSLNENRAKIDLFSILYEKKEINKTIDKNDFMLAIEEYHNDSNITRINNICRICYYLRKNENIWNSDIIFRSLYIFENIKDYQIQNLISSIENIINK